MREERKPFLYIRPRELLLFLPSYVPKLDQVLVAACVPAGMFKDLKVVPLIIKHLQANTTA